MKLQASFIMSSASHFVGVYLWGEKDQGGLRRRVYDLASTGNAEIYLLHSCVLCPPALTHNSPLPPMYWHRLRPLLLPTLHRFHCGSSQEVCSINPTGARILVPEVHGVQGIRNLVSYNGIFCMLE